MAHVFDPPLVQGVLLRRYKRFLSDIRLDSGEEVVAHCANPGAMTGLDAPGGRVWLSHHDNPKRKLAWTWQIAVDATTGARVGVNPMLANRLVAEAIAAGVIADLDGYETLRTEVRSGESRLDIHLSSHPDDPRPCWVEVKSVTLGLDDGVAAFPDAPTARGRRHLAVLAERAQAKERAVSFYLVQRNDARAMAPADDVDPAYGKALRAAVSAGVEVMAWRVAVSPTALTVAEALPVQL